MQVVTFSSTLNMFLRYKSQQMTMQISAVISFVYLSIVINGKLRWILEKYL